ILIDDDEDFCKSVDRWVKRMNQAKDADPENPIQLHVTSKTDDFLGLVNEHANASGKTLALIDMDIWGDKEAGLNLLETIKLRSPKNVSITPSVIYSNSSDPKEILQSYSYGANSFYWKGEGTKQKSRFSELVRHWRDFVSNPHEHSLVALK
ncbi:hypothetical protein, partial [Pseudophaeobacter sp.]|uniref:hypothetical protein n=1 Tax=Pseudophaeobacter sp. TaxID=1971739 RepID=UPI003297C11D